MTNGKPPGTENVPENLELKKTGVKVGDGASKDVYQTSGSHCNKDGCKLAKSEEEKAWEELWSGRVSDQDIDPPLPAQGKTAPSPERYAEVLHAVRPPGVHAIMAISTGWNAHVKSPMVTTTKPALTSAFETLKGSWEGDDFTKFTERVTATHKFIDDILGNLGGETNSDKDTIITGLNNYATNLSQQQTGCRFPAAQVWSHEGGTSSEDRVHIRPPWHVGDCHEMGLAEAAEKLVNGMQGASSDYSNMTSSWTAHFKSCANPNIHFYAYGGRGYAYQAKTPKPGESCESLPADKQRSDGDAKKFAENYTTSVARLAKDKIYEDYEKNYRETADDIKKRVNTANDDYSKDHPKLDTTTPPPPGLPGENPNTPPPGLGGPPPGSVPPPGGLPKGPMADVPPPIKPGDTPDIPTPKPYDPPKPDITPPGVKPPGDHGGFQGVGDPGFSKVPPGGGGWNPGGGGGIGTPGGGGWTPGGGGGVGTPGGGVGMLGGAGAGGVGAGAAGKGAAGRGGMGMMGGAGAGAGKGAAGAGGKGAGAGMMGGGRGGAHGNENEEHGTWLQEDDDVWGTDGDDAPPSLLR
ncbi:hypothetical protein Afil01_66300 [Actinorhabdospora filicis]|uniref:Uncharacterized protein n=1 Tax=Actinorhabdospora filicis TaxID=1785913 RepID=A0A9W6STK7_9ACTN|nr:hypothetical protein [Actinorhabdospora filicis]GLZ81823.1 hypothetical protein Afil01_66300 [Actinorhabdospora filicis]